MAKEENRVFTYLLQFKKKKKALRPRDCDIYGELQIWIIFIVTFMLLPVSTCFPSVY